MMTPALTLVNPWTFPFNFPSYYFLSSLYCIFILESPTKEDEWDLLGKPRFNGGEDQTEEFNTSYCSAGLLCVIPQ